MKALANKNVDFTKTLKKYIENWGRFRGTACD